MTPQELKFSIFQKAYLGQLVEQNYAEPLPDVKKINLDEDPFEIPESWCWSTLGNCCEMYTGNSIPENIKKTKYTGLSDGHNYIATKDISFQQSIDYDNGVKIPFNEDFKIAYKNAILMCIEGGSAGRKIGILDQDVCFGNKLCMFYTKKLYNKYVFYYLQSPAFRELFSGNMTGIIGGVSIKKLKNILIPIPPLSEQKRIVAKIEELLPFIDRYEQAWSKLEQFNSRFPEDMKKSLLQYAIQGKLVEQRPEDGTAEELFARIQEEKQRLIAEKKIKKEKPLPEITDNEKPFDIPESWKWVSVGSVCTNIQYGSSQKSATSGKVAVLRMGNIQDGKLILDKLVYTSDEAEIEKYPLKYNDLLFNRTNSKELVGKTAIYKGEIPAIYAGYLVRITPLYMNSDYLNYVMQSQFYWSYCQSVRSDAIGQSNINAEKLKRFVFPLPPLAEQKRIVEKLEQLLPLCERLG